MSIFNNINFGELADKIQSKLKDNEDNHEDASNELNIPFSEFFDSYFRDEAGSLPQSVEGRVWFIETLSINKFDKLIDKLYKVQQKNELRSLTSCQLIIDVTLTKNLGAGVFVEVGGDRYIIRVNYSSQGWETITELKSAYYDTDDNYLSINGYRMLVLGNASKVYAKRLVECINAYLNQNEQRSEIVASNSEPVTDALNNIDRRIDEIRDKLAILREIAEDAN